VTPRPDSLARRAARRLEAGPVHTLELAREVLGLEGHPGAAAAAVFQLLGADSRFRVDRHGVWRLDGAESSESGRGLAEVRFAVVDVETTGGSFARGHRVTDLAIVEVHDGAIVDEYRTLVNPGRSIPPGIVALTGITHEMVRGAPYFDHIGDEVARRLEGRVFVAHNAPFDWSFVAGELAGTAGGAPDVARLCTVRLVRRLVPELRHRNLDTVARHFGLDVAGRHRAYGDALATARVLLRLLDEAMGRGLHDMDALERFLGRRGRRAAADPRQTRLPLERHGTREGGT